MAVSPYLVVSITCYRAGGKNCLPVCFSRETLKLDLHCTTDFKQHQTLTISPSCQKRVSHMYPGSATYSRPQISTTIQHQAVQQDGTGLDLYAVEKCRYPYVLQESWRNIHHIPAADRKS
ncbi:hypothetical protein NFI96_024235 [Prochilodus magdalenae]|nr:hypothetical protein NFI96_024235 [Prochilodus magdalenae]